MKAHARRSDLLSAGPVPVPFTEQYAREDLFGSRVDKRVRCDG
jgi:hypothetical protein